MTVRPLICDRLGALTELFVPEVELVSVTRNDRNDLARVARASIDRGVQLNVRGVFPVGGHDALFAAAAEITRQDKNLIVLLDDVFACSEMLGELVGCNLVGFRIQTLREPMCPRFHVDRIPCRLLVTYGGPGTEWITERWLDRSSVGGVEPDNYPVIDGGGHQQLQDSAISVLKGALWSSSVGEPGQGYGGVVHRSPRAPEGRILMSLDPVH